MMRRETLSRQSFSFKKCYVSFPRLLQTQPSCPLNGLSKIMSEQSFTLENELLQSDLLTHRSCARLSSFSHSDLFWGHWIAVSGSLNEGPKDAGIHG